MGYTRDAEGWPGGDHSACGDAYVRAPDGEIAGLVWETGNPEYFREIIAPDPAGRWGTYAVQLDASSSGEGALPSPSTTTSLDGHELPDEAGRAAERLRCRWPGVSAPGSA